jgi:ABC-type nickel/cobalt efflux system permease component RcnA
MENKDNDIVQDPQTEDQQHHHSHYHHEHHHEHHEHHHHHEHHGGKHVDGSERFKIHNLSAAKRRKLMEKWTFRILCILAIVITLLCIYLYQVDN